MVNWEYELKQSISKQFEKIIGNYLSLSNIQIVDIDIQVNDELLKLLGIQELGSIYAYAIMQEKFEQASLVKKLLVERGCKIDFDINEKTMTGVLDISFIPKKVVKHIKIDMVITPEGMMVDFDKE